MEDRLPGSAAPSEHEAEGRPALADAFHHLAYKTSVAVGTPWAFALACALILIWAASGPLFQFREVWQLVINTGTTIITFLMVFLIQATQNRDSRALHLKLDELIRASEARDVFAGLEDASEAELERFHAEFKALHQRGEAPIEAARAARHRARHATRG